MVAVETGMAARRVESAFKYVYGEFRPDIIVSAGFGGALSSDSKIGDLILASRYYLINSDQSHQSSYAYKEFPNHNPVPESVIRALQNKISIKTGSFITLSEWTSKSRIREMLPMSMPLPVCDRETFHLASLSDQHSLPFIGMRVITDRAHEDIRPELFTITDENGMYRASRAVGLLLTNPSLIPETIRLAGHALRASKNLWVGLKALLEILPPTENAAYVTN